MFNRLLTIVSTQGLLLDQRMMIVLLEITDVDQATIYIYRKREEGPAATGGEISNRRGL